MKARSKIILSVSALVAALAVSTTATFAWFTTSKNPTVDSFEMNVQTRTDSVSIAVAKDLTSAKALTDGDYVSKITKAKIDTVLAELSNPKLGAVTTADGVAFKDVEDGAVTANANNGYISLVFAFKADKAMDIKFENASSNSKINSTTGTSLPIKAWKDISENEYGTHAAISKGENVTAAAKDAARVSFVATADNTAAAFGTSGKIWYPNNTFGYVTGNLAQDYLDYLNGTTTSSKTPAAAATDWTAPVVVNTLFAQKTVAADNPYYAYLQVNVWLEGWDGDCFNSILQQVLQVGLEFSATAPTPAE